MNLHSNDLDHLQKMENVNNVEVLVPHVVAPWIVYPVKILCFFSMENVLQAVRTVTMPQINSVMHVIRSVAAAPVKNN